MGRSEVGSVGNGTGYNAYPLLDKENNRVISNVKITPTGEFQILANVQEHWSMEGRAIVREANAEKYVKKESFASSMGAESVLKFGVKTKKKTLHSKLRLLLKWCFLRSS